MVHYTMGGVKVDSYGRVVRADGTPVAGLFAAGEIIVVMLCTLCLVRVDVAGV